MALRTLRLCVSVIQYSIESQDQSIEKRNKHSFSKLRSKSIGLNIDIRIIGDHHPVDKSASLPAKQIQFIFPWHDDKRMLLIPHFVVNPALEPAFIRGYDVMPGT